MLFCGLDLHRDVPDETTPCRFRNSLLAGGIYDKLLAEVCRQLEAHSLKLHEVETTIVNFTLIVSAARPRALLLMRHRTVAKRKYQPLMRYISVPMQMPGGSGGKSTLDYNCLTTDQKTPRLSIIRMRMGKPGLE